jgi:peptide/nickel transport system permease protein
MMSQPTNPHVPHVPHASTELYDLGVDEPVIETPVVETAALKQGVLKRLVHRFSVLGLIGLVLVTFWLIVAFIGPLVAPYNGGTLTSTEIFGSYSTAYPLGTDYLGRDMLSRILYGARYTVGLALAAAVLASLIGTFFGLLAAVSTRRARCSRSL